MNISSPHAVTQFESGHADEQVREGDADALRLVLAVNLPSSQRY